MQNKRLFLDLHIIQSLPPSNINRDDTGSPKTSQYGGVTRSRVSSQSWKKAMRDYFKELGQEENVGVRTLEIVRYVASHICEIDPSIDQDTAMEMAEKVINAGDIKTKEKRARALFFMGDKQARGLAQAAIDQNTDKDYIKEILRDNPPIDIALFGRMVADDPSLNEDASSQVAHAISTHGVQVEFDYFTAADDLKEENSVGAGMIGNIEYNSSTLYRYANVSIHDLKRQVGKEKVVDALGLFIEAFARSMPTGKSNTFANQTYPEALLVSLRTDRPASLVTALEEPIISVDGYSKKSIDKMFEEYKDLGRFMDEPAYTGYITKVPQENIEKELDSLRDLIEDTKDQIQKLID